MVENLQTLDPSELSQALDQLHPAPLEALALTASDTAHMINSTFMDRLSFLRNSCICYNSCNPCFSGGFWTAGSADFIRQNKTDGLRRFTTANEALSLGYDNCISDSIWTGIGGGYSQSNLHWGNSTGNDNIHDFYVGLYATKYEYDYYLDRFLIGICR